MCVGIFKSILVATLCCFMWSDTLLAAGAEQFDAEANGGAPPFGEEHVPVASSTLGPGELAFEKRLVEAERETNNWLLHGRTHSEQRYSPLKKIHRKNVDKLGFAWSFDIRSTRGLEATPIFRDGVLYTTGTWSVIFAIDARTGQELWRYDPEVPRSWGRKGCCDVVNRGVAVWGDRVISGTFDGRLVALNAKDGQLIWETNTIDRTKPATITGAPRVVNGKVIIGNGGAEFGMRGYVSAYDVLTGKLVWRFFVVPGSPDGPHEHAELEAAAKTWSRHGEWRKTGGGGTVWDSISYDPELNLVYVGTGNGAPHARHRRSPGGGDNLYLSSILALDADTGSMKWYYQTTPGDSWDFTATQQMILADLKIEGKNRKVLMQAPKNGFFYVLDRETGELISAEKFVSVNWASHIENGRPVETKQADYSNQEKLTYPSELGGHNWHPMSFSPKTGMVYIPAMEWGWVHSPNQFYLFDKNVPHIEELRKEYPVEEGGYLRAWDPVTQAKVWEVKHPGYINGGTLVTAGNLVFQGTQDGYFNAYDAETGKRLLNLFLGTGVIAAPITYQIDGQQYIAIMAGFGGATFFMLDDSAAARNYKNDGRLIVLKLDGSEIPLPVENASVDKENSISPEVSDSIKRGEKLYLQFCGVCHGMFGTKPILPDLTKMQPEINAIFEFIVLDGVFESKGMASFADVLDKEDVKNIQDYLNSRSSGD